VGAPCLPTDKQAAAVPSIAFLMPVGHVAKPKPRSPGMSRKTQNGVAVLTPRKANVVRLKLSRKTQNGVAVLTPRKANVLRLRVLESDASGAAALRSSRATREARALIYY
jgi:hypothetical protein